ncbi:MAG: FHA domain-containing protein [Aquihabitans sp.]
MADVFCNNCGHRNSVGSNFCSSCGQPLDQPTNEPATITFALDPTGGVEDLVLPIDEISPGGTLIVTRGPNSGSKFALENHTTTVGRHPDSDIFLDDVTVSRLHVEVERSGDSYVARDVGSLNGTYVNRTLIDGDQPLANGDELQVGRFKLVYVAGTES